MEERFMIIDSHAHYDDESYNKDREDIKGD